MGRLLIIFVISICHEFLTVDPIDHFPRSEIGSIYIPIVHDSSLFQTDKTMPTGINSTLPHPDLVSSLDLRLVISDRNVLAYLAQFDDEETRCAKAIEALKAGVIAIQSASPMLDTQVVQAKFAEVESRLRDQMNDFQTKVGDNLRQYFAEQHGSVPRSIEGVFGEGGALTRTFQGYFDPTAGSLARLMQSQIGPQSTFARALDPQNKQGVLALMEARVEELVESKLDEVLEQFSLDADGSAMCRLRGMLSDFFVQLNQSLGIQDATAAEAARGHVKGMVFEDKLYYVFADIGRQLGDQTEAVGTLTGAVARSKKGDFVATLGETSGSPGLKIVVEVKDQALRLKDAIDELQEAKENRDAKCGIFVFARGAEPPEVGDFRRIGEDFYVTVDKDDLAAGKPLVFLDSAYKIARVMVVAEVRKQHSGQLDLQLIQDQVQALGVWADKLADMTTKAKTIQGNGKIIEDYARDMKLDLDTRVAVVLKALQNAVCG